MQHRTVLYCMDPLDRKCTFEEDPHLFKLLSPVRRFIIAGRRTKSATEDAGVRVEARATRARGVVSGTLWQVRPASPQAAALPNGCLALVWQVPSSPDIPRYSSASHLHT